MRKRKVVLHEVKEARVGGRVGSRVLHHQRAGEDERLGSLAGLFGGGRGRRVGEEDVEVNNGRGHCCE